MATSQKFVIADYLIFFSMLFLSGGIGLFYAIKDRKKQNTEDYLLAGRSMSPYPVAFSLCVSFLSAVTVLGTPAEVYVYGTMYIWVLFGCLVAFTLTATIYLPVFYKSNIASVNQYLERRFNRSVRLFATVIYLLQTVLYVGVVIYAPALVISTVTDVHLWGAALTTGVVCILYSSLGGLKAVIWTDTLQMLIMVIGFLSVIIKASIDSGGIAFIWQKAYEGRRLEFWKFDFDPRIRHTIWSVGFGSCFFNLALYAANQAQVQRYLSCRSLKSAKLAIAINYIGMFFLLSLAVLCGVVMYGYYHSCDPVYMINNGVSKPDQLIPFMVLQLYQSMPGMPGLFTAAVYSGSLSTVSTAITAMTSVTIQDLLKPFVNWTDAKLTWLSRGLVIVYGLLCIFTAYLTSQLGGILQVAISILSVAGAPLLTAFTLGIFAPFANTMGALAGMCGATFGTVWIFCGKIMFPVSNFFKNPLPFANSGCANVSYNGSAGSPAESPFFDQTTITDSFTTVKTTTSNHPPMADLYAMSYMYITGFGFLIGITVGLIISLVTGGWKQRVTVEPALLWSALRPADAKSYFTKKYDEACDECKARLTVVW